MVISTLTDHMYGLDVERDQRDRNPMHHRHRGLTNVGRRTKTKGKQDLQEKDNKEDGSPLLWP
jgi:hypothetical protein